MTRGTNYMYMWKIWTISVFSLAIFLAFNAPEYIYKYSGVPGTSASMLFLLLVCLYATPKLDKFSKITIILSLVSFIWAILYLGYTSEDKERVELVRLIIHNVCRGSLVLMFLLATRRMIQRYKISMTSKYRC